jgi:hypothetical protein
MKRGPMSALGMLAAAGLVFGQAGPALAQDRSGSGHPGHDHRATGVRLNTVADADADLPGERRNAVEWVTEVGSGTVDVSNRAEAISSCDGCRSIALAVQVVIVEHAEGTVNASNVAESLTIRCSHCTAVALAYQFVIADGGRLVLRESARTRIEELGRAMRRAAVGNLPDAQLKAREDRLAIQLAGVLRTGVVRVVERPTSAGSGAGSPATVAAHADHDGRHGSACAASPCR